MSTAARKARKRAGIPFTKAQKTPTPVLERSNLTMLVPGAHGTRYAGKWVPRSEKSRERIIGIRTVPATAHVEYVANGLRARAASIGADIKNAVKRLRKK